MDRGKKEVPPVLTLTSMLSASITIVLSVTYIILSILGLVYRYDCDAATQGGDPRGQNHFMNMVLRVYIIENECPNSLDRQDLTSPDSVFALNIITLCASILTLIAAITLILMVQIEEYVRFLHVTVYIYVGTWFASFIVDLTYGTHFGMDYTHLSNLMFHSSAGLPSNYDTDMIRLGALLLFAVTLKGFVAHAIQLVLMVLLVIYIVDFQKQSQIHEHSIHKMGALNAYDRPRQEQQTWQPDAPMFLGQQQRGPLNNPAFIDDSPPRSPRREPSMSDYTRSESWQPSMLSGPRGPREYENGRPFSYLEESKKPVVPPRPASPAEQQWRRNEWAPPVPAPDYSPQTPRRLKSALKPSYM